jgi:hypothetical protein
MVTEKEVKKQVARAFMILAKNARAGITEQDLPQINIEQAAHSFYVPEERRIIVSQKDINNGSAYFEEASHALRHITQEKQGVPYYKQDAKVHEFFGRIGETLGRQLSKGTELEHLFHRKPRNFTRFASEFEKDEEALKQEYLMLKAREAKVKTAKQILAIKTSENYHQLHKLLNDFKADKINFKKFSRRFRNLYTSYKKTLDKLRTMPDSTISEIDMIEAGLYKNNYDNLREFILENQSLEKSQHAGMMIQKSLSNLTAYKPKFVKCADNPEAIETKIKAKEMIRTLDTHTKPYVYAEQYSLEELMQYPLYNLSDKEIRQRFFRKPNSVVEKTISAIFYILSPVFIINMLSALNLTGHAINMTNSTGTANFTLGMIFNITFLFFAAAFMYFKLFSHDRDKK